jgi:hypothetical protein
MLRIFIENCKWGADNTDEGMQLNFLDEESGFMVHVPFNMEAIDAMEKMIEDARENQNKND